MRKIETTLLEELIKISFEFHESLKKKINNFFFYLIDNVRAHVTIATVNRIREEKNK